MNFSGNRFKTIRQGLIIDQTGSDRGKYSGLVLAFALSFCVVTSFSQDELSLLPVPVDTGHFQALKMQSPFTRTLNVSDSLVLTGVAQIDGKPVATLLDTKTSQSYVISGEPDANGWRMVALTPGDDLEQLVASISINGGEVVRVRYDREGISRSAKSRPSVSGGVRVPHEIDRRPIPTEEDRKRFGEFVKGRMSTMSEDQRKKVGEIFGAKMKENPKMSDRQKGELFKQVLDHVAPEKK